MRQRYRMYETNATRLGRLVIHWAGVIITLIILHKMLDSLL